MEHAAEVINSPNFLLFAVVVFALLFAGAFLSKRGFFSYNGKGLKIGKSDSDARLLIMRQVDFVNAFIMSKKQELMGDFRKIGMEPDLLHLSYVFEKMYDKVLYWLLVNNIRLDRTYVQAKAADSKMVIYSAIGEVNQELLSKKEVAEIVDRISMEYTEELLSGLVQIKIEEEKNAC